MGCRTRRLCLLCLPSYRSAGQCDVRIALTGCALLPEVYVKGSYLRTSDRYPPPETHGCFDPLMLRHVRGLSILLPPVRRFRFPLFLRTVPPAHSCSPLVCELSCFRPLVGACLLTRACPLTSLSGEDVRPSSLLVWKNYMGSHAPAWVNSYVSEGFMIPRAPSRPRVSHRFLSTALSRPGGERR